MGGQAGSIYATDVGTYLFYHHFPADSVRAVRVKHCWIGREASISIKIVCHYSIMRTPELIFKVFVDMVVETAKCDLDTCKFDYFVHDKSGHIILEVVYFSTDKCERQKPIPISFEITNICPKDLESCEIIAFLQTLACQYACDLCRPDLVLVRTEPKGCRTEAPLWTPPPPRSTIVINHCPEKIEPIHRVEVVVRETCPCVEPCRREPTRPTKRIIIQDDPIQDWKCGDNSRLVDTRPGKYGMHKEVIDYNHHSMLSGHKPGYQGGMTHHATAAGGCRSCQ